MAKVITWTNKFSQETGYVKKISKAKGFFENTFVKEEARKFRSEKEAMNAVAQLTEIGEDKNNDFAVVEL
ncbi:MAG: hypothetical protein Q4C42_11930 [Clostridia bacterium]|nr:hypothetical protein [Clostridia bacterium]